MTDVAALLAEHWGLRDVEVRPLGGGMNSQTWLVGTPGSRYVVKQVAPGALADLVAGAEVARSLAAAGLATGPPVPTRDGELLLADRGVVLLEHVSGRELTGDSDQEQRWMATTLGAVHVAGLHTDPAPEAFVHDDSTGVTGLIDWAGAQRGPVLYDVASAVMYLGGVDRASVFLDTYLSEGPVGADELRHLDAFRRLRWAVQGAYFARRLVTDDLTGGVDRADNEKGLADARRGLEELDLDVG